MGRAQARRRIKDSAVAAWRQPYLQGHVGSADALTEGWGHHAIGFWSFLEERVGGVGAWASSTTREGWSAACDTSGPGITADRRSPEQHPWASGTPTTAITIQNMQNRVETQMINRLARYCFIDDCLCADGSPSFHGAPYTPLEASPMWIGSGSLSRGPTRTSVPV